MLEYNPFLPPLTQGELNTTEPLFKAIAPPPGAPALLDVLAPISDDVAASTNAMQNLDACAAKALVPATAMVVVSKHPQQPYDSEHSIDLPAEKHNGLSPFMLARNKYVESRKLLERRKWTWSEYVQVRKDFDALWDVFLQQLLSSQAFAICRCLSSR